MLDSDSDCYLIKSREIQSDFRHHFIQDGVFYRKPENPFHVKENVISLKRDAAETKIAGDRDIRIVLSAYACHILPNGAIDILTNIIIDDAAKNDNIDFLSLQAVNKLTVKQLNTHWLSHDLRSCLRVKEGIINPYYSGQFVVHLYNYTTKTVNIEPGAAIAEIHITEFEYNVPMCTFVD